MAAIPFQPMMESRPIREIAYEVLKHAIITGEIPAGERIVETEYADRLHISRTPLREALRKLERDGLVEYVQRRGVIVRAFTIADVEEIYTIRNALEMLGVLLEGMDLEVTDTLPVEFSCNCSKDRVRKALISIGREELQSMIDDGKEIEVNCHFCGKHYEFNVDELKNLLKKAVRA